MYVNINFMAFHKILKKHDKYLPDVPCRKFYLSKLHQQKWIKSDFSKTFVRLSKAHQTLRGDEVPEDQELATEFVRKTTKYWIRTSDISRLKHTVLQVGVRCPRCAPG